MRVRKSRRPVLAAGVISAGMLLAACGGSDGSDGGGGSGEIDTAATALIGSVPNAATLDPQMEPHQGARPATFLLFDRLTRLTPDMELVPMLATEWTFSEDGKALTMMLRDDVTFNDGTPLDAEAVKATIERGQTMQGSMLTDELESIKSVEVVSPTEVTFVLSNPEPGLPSVLSGPAGAIINPKMIEEGVDLTEGPAGAGSGPYTIEKFVSNESYVVVPADDDYWDDSVGRLSQLEIRYVDPQRTRMSAFRGGELDVAYVNPYSATDIAEAEELAKSDQDVEFLEHPTGVVFSLNIRGTLVKDERIRQAIAHAIDRDAIGNDLMQGYCTPIAQVAGEGWPGHDENFEDPYPYDPERAKELLADAGAEGMTLKMQHFVGREQIPTAMQEMLNAVGFNVELVALQGPETVSSWMEDQNELFAYQQTPDLSFPRTAGYVMTGAVNYGVSVPEIDKAIAESNLMTDDAERESAYQAIVSDIADEAMFVPLCQTSTYYVSRSDVVDLDAAMMQTANFMGDFRYLAKTN